MNLTSCLICKLSSLNYHCKQSWKILKTSLSENLKSSSHLTSFASYVINSFIFFFTKPSLAILLCLINFRFNVIGSFGLSYVVFYSHNNINNNKYRRYERVYFFLPSFLGNTRREIQIIKAYANHTILTPRPYRHGPSCGV